MTSIILSEPDLFAALLFIKNEYAVLLINKYVRTPAAAIIIKYINTATR